MNWHGARLCHSFVSHFCTFYKCDEEKNYLRQFFTRNIYITCDYSTWCLAARATHRETHEVHRSASRKYRYKHVSHLLSPSVIYDASSTVYRVKSGSREVKKPRWINSHLTVCCDMVGTFRLIYLFIVASKDNQSSNGCLASGKLPTGLTYIKK